MDTNSLNDMRFTVSHPHIGQYVFSEKEGKIIVNKAKYDTVNDVASDGNIMISKILKSPNEIILYVEQSSPLNNWLIKLFRYIQHS